MISVRSLSKHYRVHSRAPGLLSSLRSLFHRQFSTIRAVEGISFEIAPGERVGFLGPNGAGKTTTLKALTGLLHPTSGEISVAGHEPRRRAADFLRSIMLVTGQKHQLIWDLPPADTFELNRAIYDIPRREFAATLEELVTLLDLGTLLGRPTRQLSMGERMKCELTAALLHRPRVLFLDEPTIGLDVTMQSTVRRFIREYNERHGATVLLTSHYMADVAALCPRVLVIDRGHLIYDGPLEELGRTARPDKRVTLRLARTVEEADLRALRGKIVDRSNGLITWQAPRGEVPQLITQALASLPVEDLSITEPPLEDVLADLFARSPAAGADPGPEEPG